MPQIARAYGADESAIPADYNDLAVEVGKQLEHATEAQPLIVFLDALDQFGETDPARQLSWLLAHLPENVRVVVSTIPGDCEKTLRLKRPELAFLSLDNMLRKEGEQALNIWLDLAGRILQDPQRKEILDAFEPEGRPLYLKLAFEEARLWHSYSPAAETTLKAGIGELIASNLFPRLADPANHGAALVSHALGYLAASRYGLAEDELIDVLSDDADVIAAFEAGSRHKRVVNKLPVVLWSRLYFDLAPYLAEHAADGTTLLAFYHRVLGEAATDLYLAGVQGGHGKARHAALADYFRNKADPAHDGSWELRSRPLTELPLHLARAGSTKKLEPLLSDLSTWRLVSPRAPFTVSSTTTRWSVPNPPRRSRLGECSSRSTRNACASTPGSLSHWSTTRGSRRRRSRSRRPTGQTLVAHCARGDPPQGGRKRHATDDLGPRKHPV